MDTMDKETVIEIARMALKGMQHAIGYGELNTFGYKFFEETFLHATILIEQWTVAEKVIL